MSWYFRTLLRDRRFRLAALVGATSLGATTAGVLLGEAWSLKVVTYAVFPVFGLSLAAMFVVLGLIVRDDYTQRKG